MGFNLFINLLNIIEDILSLANRFKTKEIMNELKRCDRVSLSESFWVFI